MPITVKNIRMVFINALAVRDFTVIGLEHCITPHAQSVKNPLQDMMVFYEFGIARSVMSKVYLKTRQLAHHAVVR